MKIKELVCRIQEVKRIKGDVSLFCLIAPYLAKVSSPGQFLHVKIKSTILRRPFSIHKVYQDKVYILLKVKGRGTSVLSQYRKGDMLDVIGPLGKGFDIKLQATGCRLQAAGCSLQVKEIQNILVAGGMGVAPLVFLGDKLREMQNATPKVSGQACKMQNLALLGVKNKDEVLCEQEFKKFGFKVFIATQDGSRGYRGTVVDLLQNKLLALVSIPYVNIYACGPKEMFFEMSKILEDYPSIKCQVSFEQFMGCGLGMCCGCTIETKDGYKKVCKDGPVFDIKDI